MLGFQPASLKPLAYRVDTGGRWDNESYVKLGFGSLSTPYLQAGLSLGDGANRLAGPGEAASPPRGEHREITPAG